MQTVTEAQAEKAYKWMAQYKDREILVPDGLNKAATDAFGMLQMLSHGMADDPFGASEHGPVVVQATLVALTQAFDLS